MMMNKFRDPKVQGALRHLLTSTGPILAMYGVTNQETWGVMVGLAMAVYGFWASWTAKEKKNV